MAVLGGVLTKSIWLRNVRSFLLSVQVSSTKSTVNVLLYLKGQLMLDSVLTIMACAVFIIS